MTARQCGVRAIAGACAVLLFAAAARANVCAQDAVPAATLLFPYVAVDVKSDGSPDPAGQTTITRVTNVSPETAIVHFTVWDVAGMPRFTFDEVLAGYDALQINWRDVLSGRRDLFDTSREDITVTRPKTRDPYEWGPDGRGQDGGIATPENRSAVTAGQCPGPPPYGNLSELAPTLRTLLHGAVVSRQHLGECEAGASLRATQLRFGEALPASLLFFYVTADVVHTCTALTPADTSYWSGVARAANVLVGDVIYLNATANTSEMTTAVHVEAVREGEPRPASGFYGEKAGVATGREPLATAFALEYANDARHRISSSVMLWKNFTELDAVDDPSASVWGRPSDCGSYVAYIWDMDERSLSITRHPICVWECPAPEEPNQFPFATQKVPLTNEYFDLPDTSGWMLIVLPPSYGAGFVDPTPDGQGYLTRPYMGWAGLQFDYGSYSAGSQAASMGNALCDPAQALPRLASNPGTTREPGFCARDQAPAATLLFPHVTVDLGSDGAPDPQGQTTITRIVNSAPEAAIVHFTMWDAIGVPRLSFDEILSGYDALEINWRDALNGRFDRFDTSTDPFTAMIPETLDPFEWGPDARCTPGARWYDCRGGLIAPQNRDVVGAQCPQVPPYGDRSDLAETIRQVINGVLVAREHAGCGEARGLRQDKTPFGGAITKSPTFFYVTADVVKWCNLEFPTDALYWTAYASTANVLLGDVIYLNASANTSEMIPAVHIEAASEHSGGPSVAGFYEERSGAETNREPLATAFMLEYGNDPGSGVTSNLIFWKNFTEFDTADDPARDVLGNVVDCGSYAYYAFDVDGRSLSVCRDCIIDADPYGGIDPNQLPLATQKVPLNSTYFDLPDAYGFMLIVLPPSYGAGFVDPTPDDRGYRSRPYMGWAGVQFDYGGYSAGAEAITMGNALCFPGQVLPGLGVTARPAQVRRHLPSR